MLKGRPRDEREAPCGSGVTEAGKVAKYTLTLGVVGDPGKLLALEQVLAPFGIVQYRAHRQNCPGAGIRH